MQFRTAERKQAKLRLGISAPSGAGKTYSSLLIAQGMKPDTVAMIDTEHGSGDLYSDIMPYQILTLDAPYTPNKYIEGIKMAEKEFDALNRNVVIIIDSLTHAWAGAGGVLDIHNAVTKSSRSGNSWMAWREVTPQHEALVNTMLQSPAHIIATVRSKQAYAMKEGDKGMGVEKLGMEPIQRDGMEYEFTVFGDMSISHIMTVTKDRTRLFNINDPFVPSPETGEKLLNWLMSGAAVEPPKLLTYDDMIKQINTHADIHVSREWYQTNKASIDALTPEQKTELNKIVQEKHKVKS
jgi:hypothetical protein